MDMLQEICCRKMLQEMCCMNTVSERTLIEEHFTII